MKATLYTRHVMTSDEKFAYVISTVLTTVFLVFTNVMTLGYYADSNQNWSWPEWAIAIELNLFMLIPVLIVQIWAIIKLIKGR